MHARYTKLKEKSWNLPAAGVALMVLSWLFDAFLDWHGLPGGSLAEAVFNPSFHTLCSRLSPILLIGLLLFYAHYLTRERESLAEDLHRAMVDAQTQKVKAEGVLAAIGDGVSIQDTDFRILYQNEVHKSLVGGDFTGNQCFKAYNCRDEVCPDCPIAVCYRDGTIHKTQKLISLPSKETYVEITASPLRDDKGRIIAGIELLRDISESRQTENKIRHLNEKLAQRAAQLAITNRELEAFSSSVSHDLRNPLTRIYSSGQLLREEYGPALGEEGLHLARTICEGCENMEELIEALLSLSRVASIELHSSPCNLSTIAELTATDLRLSEPSRQVRISIEEGLFDDADARLIKVLLENLLGNSWKYTEKTVNAQIEFGVAPIEGNRVYFVRDNGAGFAMEQAHLLFKPFQRLHDAADFKGTGIGLATVQRIVERHGGRVWCEGEPGHGATFYFTLRACP
jgi:signal transduction histidine kinase